MGASISHALFRRTIIKLIRLARTSQNVLSLLICASLAAGNLPIRGMHQGPLLHIWFLNWKYALFVTNGSKIDRSLLALDFGSKGLKLEGEVDMTVSFNYLVMPDKLMKARSLYGEGLLFLYCQKLGIHRCEDQISEMKTFTLVPHYLSN